MPTGNWHAANGACLPIRTLRRNSISEEYPMNQLLKHLVAGTVAALAAAGAQAGLVYNQNVTNNVITGSGISNGGFTVDVANGIEIGLRARERYGNPTSGGVYSPTGNINISGNGTYSHAAGGFTPAGGATGTSPGPRAGWNFDWSINTGTANISAYGYRIGIDYDAGVGTNFRTFDLISGINPNPAAGGLALWDHSFGNNSTAMGAGTEASGATLAASKASYDNLKTANSLVQNSWNLAFFTDPSHSFDPTADGKYTIFLEATGANGNVLAHSEINVIVGAGAVAVPEPDALALTGLALAGLAATRRRRAH